MDYSDLKEQGERPRSYCQVESAEMTTCNNGKGIHLRMNLST
jgi:hypothetical protein